MHRVRTGDLPWTNFDALHRITLVESLDELGIAGFDDVALDALNQAWRRLDPWPDAVSGLTRLKSRYVVATLSNGNVSQLVALAKYGGLPWDCVLSAELSHHYKPDPEVYLSAASLLSLEPAQVMMVAAHPPDLAAARRVGFKSAFVPRPLERGPERADEVPADPDADIVAADFNDLAEQLGAQQY
jgi:2-haloacid dehalogenase